MKIIAFDPGVTTGVAIWQEEQGAWPEEWNRFTLGPDDHHQQLFSMLDLSYDVVIWESFQYRGQTSAILKSVEYIGVLELVKQNFARSSPSTIFHPQPSSVAKGFWNDKRLKQIDLWTNVTHTRDATRHLLYYRMQQLKHVHLVDKLK